METEHTAHIHAWNLPALVEKLAAYGRTAVKLGLDAPVMTVGERYTRKANGIATPIVVVTITGNAPRLDGWQLLATLEHTEHGNVVRGAPGVGDLPEYREVPPLCEHCNKIRRRSETFVVEHESGKRQQVGRSCLRDFLGHDPIPWLMGAAEFAELFSCRELSEEPVWRAGDVTIDLSVFLPWVVLAIRKFGWVSRSMADRTDRAPTSVVATELMWTSQMREYRGTGPSDEDHDLAKRAVSYTRGLDGSMSDYEHNLRVIAIAGSCTWSRTGYAASMIGYYNNAMQRAAERASMATSEHISEVGKRIEIKCTVLGVSHIPGDYGTTSLYILRTSDGNVCKWFASRAQGLGRGDTINLRGTVKAHDTYDGQKQTVLTRCKVLAQAA